MSAFMCVPLQLCVTVDLKEIPRCCTNVTRDNVIILYLEILCHNTELKSGQLDVYHFLKPGGGEMDEKG